LFEFTENKKAGSKNPSNPYITPLCGVIFFAHLFERPSPPGAVDFSNNTPHPDPLLEGEGAKKNHILPVSF